MMSNESLIQYETGAIKATYGYTDINNNLRVAQDAAGLTTSTYDGDNLRRKIVSGSVATTFVWDGADYLQIKPSTGDPTLLVLLEGEVVGHVKGSEKRDYIVDPLGSVVAYLNSSQTLTDQFEYWPYGEMVAEIEAGTEPFLWVGSLGYFRENDLRTYIRAREYRQDLGNWMQLDPLWPTTLGQTYGNSQPVSIPDPSGLDPFLGWKHGNWCGWNNYGQDGGAEDAIDACCEQHDNCVPTWCKWYMWVPCACQLCGCARSAILWGCGWNWECRWAAIQIEFAFCLQCPSSHFVPPLPIPPYGDTPRETPGKGVNGFHDGYIGGGPSQTHRL